MFTVLTESQTRLARSPRDFKLFAQGNQKRHERQVDAHNTQTRNEYRKDEYGKPFTVHLSDSGMVVNVSEGWV